jgi:hypothetical protein
MTMCSTPTSACRRSHGPRRLQVEAGIMGRESLSAFTAMARRGAVLCSINRTEPLRGIRDARRLNPPPTPTP